jgi:uncharacterized membrane protein
VAGQSIYNRAWLDFWRTDLVVIYHSIDHQHDTDLGFEQKTVAHFGGIQYPVDMAQLHGISTAFGINTCMTERPIRTMARAITYRIFALLITAYWTGLGDAIVIHVILTVLHYVFERLWLKVNWGMIRTADTQSHTVSDVIDSVNHCGHGSLVQYQKKASEWDMSSRH